MQKITGLIRRCIDDYGMISDGDVIAVGVSGGKDSLALLCALATLRRYYPKKFELHAITLSMGFEEMDYSSVVEFCKTLDVPYTIRRSELSKIIFEDRHEKNPCALCAKMRRGILHDTMKELEIKKIALGHHYDDAVETFLLSLFFEGRISCFQPVTYMSRTDITQIRPMLYVSEKTVLAAAERNKFPIVKNKCPMDNTSRRQEIKEFVSCLSEKYPDIKSKVFGAMQRYPIEGWKPAEYTRRPLP